MTTRRFFIALGLLALLATGFAIATKFGLLGSRSPADLRRIIDQVRALPYLRVSFVCIYTVAAASGVPATALTIAGGVLFGPVLGTILSWTADMLAAAASFGITRALAKSFDWKRTRDLDVQSARGFLGLLRLRVIPVVPFAALNYGSAIYGMRWRTYLGATALGIIPSTVIYTLLASSVANGVAGAGRHALTIAAVCAISAIGLSLLPRLLRPTRLTTPPSPPSQP